MFIDPLGPEISLGSDVLVGASVAVFIDPLGPDAPDSAGPELDAPDAPDSAGPELDAPDAAEQLSSVVLLGPDAP